MGLGEDEFKSTELKSSLVGLAHHQECLVKWDGAGEQSCKHATIGEHCQVCTPVPKSENLVWEDFRLVYWEGGFKSQIGF